jgi:hypothetical protein
MTYKVAKIKEEFHIIEKDTNLVIEAFEEEKEARTLCRSLNLGSGFGGYTPIFFAKQKERPPTK